MLDEYGIECFGCGIRREAWPLRIGLPPLAPSPEFLHWASQQDQPSSITFSKKMICGWYWIVFQRCTADSDEAGHAFQFEAGHPFRFEAGQGSELKPAT
jgi:hypothetical protein